MLNRSHGVFVVHLKVWIASVGLSPRASFYGWVSVCAVDSYGFTIGCSRMLSEIRLETCSEVNSLELKI